MGEESACPSGEGGYQLKWAAKLDILLRGGERHPLESAHSLAACRPRSLQSNDAEASRSDSDQISS